LATDLFWFASLYCKLHNDVPPIIKIKHYFGVESAYLCQVSAFLSFTLSLVSLHLLPSFSVEAFSNNCDQYCTLGDTLPSKMLNSLGFACLELLAVCFWAHCLLLSSIRWCGSVITDKYYNYTYCPAPIWNVTHWNGARYAFFEAASRHFASMAKVRVHGSRTT
jgi:hypothetical protein